jgi:NitT/TauT family transport system substrate-binding protein
MQSKFIVLFVVFAFLVGSCSSTTAPTSGANTPTTGNTQVASNTVAPSPVAYTPVTLKMTLTPYPSFAPIFIAQAEGYFKDYGIDLENVPVTANSQNTALFAAGTVDIYGGSLSAGLINMLAKDPNMKVVADRGHFKAGECTYEAIVVRKDLYDSGAITSAKDLAGQTIASTSTGPDAYLLSTYLAQAGLTLNDVSVSDLPKSAYIDAFANKSVAVIVTQELYLSELMNAGNAVILVSAQDVISPYQVGVLAFGKSLTVDNRDVGARFLAAYLKGVAQYNLGKTDSNLQIISAATGETIDHLKNSCWMPINEDASIDFAGIEGFQQWAVSQKLADTTLTQEQFLDPSFLAAAKQLINQ